MALAAKQSINVSRFSGNKKHSYMAMNEVKITIRQSNYKLGRCWV